VTVRIDENGTWEIENGVELLVAPSEAWTLANQPAPTVEQRWDAIRQQRQPLLNESDWTQLSDAPLLNKEAWVIYRQALRDITLQDIDTITWPTKPE
jgi:hypothetical protein